MKVSWRTLPNVLLKQELLDKAFSRARKAADRVEDRDKVFRVRKQMNRMIQTASDVLSESLIDMVKIWPSLDQMPIFDTALVDACVGCDKYRHHLSILQWGAKQIRNISSQNTRKITRTARIELMHEGRREAYGRISSIMGRVGPSLLWLNESRNTLRKLPEINQIEPVIVVCGAPNVGKSAFIASLSSGKMEVNEYPFTTKQLHVGHFEHRRMVHQMVDTPGLLDRPLIERNDIEMQAIVALEHIGSLCLFLIDSSEDCGTPLDEQLNLLEEVKQLLPGTEMIVVTSKADLLKHRPEDWDEVVNQEAQWDGLGEPELALLKDNDDRITISVLENVGVTSLRLEVVRRVKANWSNDPLSLPEGWHRR